MLGRKHKKLAVALVCADWRLHHTRSEFNRQLRRVLKVDGVDYIAVPGPDGLTLPARAGEWKAALDQVKLLIAAHAPVKIAVVAHQRCAGHPVSDEAHLEDVVATTKALKAATEFPGPASALIAQYNSDFNWKVKAVSTF
jgi:hypothetical protein